MNEQEILAAFELERLMYRAAAERFERVDGGFVSANGSLPNVWDASRVQIEPDCDAPSLDELLRLSELPSEWYPQLAHRTVFMPAGDAYRELALSLAKRGWGTDELWLMARRDPPESVPPAGKALDGSVVARLHGRLGVEQGLPARSMGEFDRFDELRGRAAARLAFAGFANGTAMSLANIYLRGDVAAIGDVATLVRARNRGLGSAAVLAGTAAALRLTARLVYLFATPEVSRGFYEKLGFERIGGAWECQRKPPST